MQPGRRGSTTKTPSNAAGTGIGSCRRALLGLVLVIAGGGCATPRQSARYVPPYGTYRNEQYPPQSVRRVLMMPMNNQSSYARIGEQVQEALASQLQSSGRFDVVRASEQSTDAGSRRVHEQGMFDERELVELRQRYQVDAVVYGTVTQFRPYEPLGLGLAVQMVDIDESVVMASLEGMWDARDRGIAEKARHYHCSSVNAEDAAKGCDLVLASPALFQAFVSHEVAQLLAAQTDSSSVIASDAVVMPVDEEIESPAEAPPKDAQGVAAPPELGETQPTVQPTKLDASVQPVATGRAVVNPDQQHSQRHCPGGCRKGLLGKKHHHQH